jgi:hypothetical protein
MRNNLPPRFFAGGGVLTASDYLVILTHEVSRMWGDVS